VWFFVASVAVAGALFAWGALRDEGGDGALREATTTSTALASAGAAPTVASAAPAPAGATPSTVPETGPGQGTLERASTAVREACRRFYDRDLQDEQRALAEDELVAVCDEPDIEWRGDCYTQRPGAFVPGVGGCAYLRGYLSVWYGRQPFAADHPAWYFTVADETWTITPESD
jgi:hypothetical protein